LGQWHGIEDFIYNAAPGQNWHVMAVKNDWGSWMNSDGTFLQSDSMDGYTYIALTSRTVTSEVSKSYLDNYVNAQLDSLSGGAADRAVQLQQRVSAHFPFQGWSVLVKKAPAGFSNWAWSDYGAASKITKSDYSYAVQGYSAQDGVYLYQDVNFESDVVRLATNVSWLGNIGFDDRLSSVAVLGPYQATLCEDPNQTGRCFSTSVNTTVSGF
jgi:1-phosphatidylinositol phosphodiesterase